MRRLICLAFLCCIPLFAAAQDKPVSLVADRVSIRSGDVLIAEGNVEVFHEGNHLRATKIVYDPGRDLLDIQGPMILISGERTILLAENAELDPALTAGILRSARLLLDQQMQIAAAQIHRVDDRYIVLDKTVASSCQVCSEAEVPLWQIRASRIVHDQKRRQIFFDNARFEIAGVPVLYLPTLRLPDPTLKRATGFLSPSLRVTDSLGTGIKIPYFIAFGDHSDLTLTPYLSTGNTRTLEMRYRRALRNGKIHVDGAVSNDDIEDETRYYLFGDANLSLPRDYELDLKFQDASDPSYLLDYDYSDEDRLETMAKLTRHDRNEAIMAEVIHYNPLRSEVPKRETATVVVDLGYERRFAPMGFGGDIGFSAGVLAFERRSDTDEVGRDLQRVSLGGDWTNSWTFQNGVQLAADARFDFDIYAVQDDSAFESNLTRFTPGLAAEIRYPLVAFFGSGASHVLEPVMQIAWASPSGDDVPNDDGLSPELDEGNLFSLSRFPGSDTVEEGLRANLGFGWTRYAPAGWSFGVTAGRVFYEQDMGQFSEGSGLEGFASDWLFSTEFFSAQNLTISNRALVDDDLSLSRNQLRVSWFQEDYEIESSYVWLEENPLEGRDEDSSEWDFDGLYRFNRHWSGTANWRYDFTQQRARAAGLGLVYRNECVTVDLSVSRRFTSSDTVTPTTDFGIGITFGGFGNNPAGQGYRRSCTRI